MTTLWIVSILLTVPLLGGCRSEPVSDYARPTRQEEAAARQDVAVVENAKGGGARVALGKKAVEKPADAESAGGEPAAARAPSRADGRKYENKDGKSTGAFRPGYGQKDVPNDFVLPYLANGEGRLSLRSLVNPEGTGQVEGVVVAFVASWCGRCKLSYPMLESLQEKYPDKLKILLLTAEMNDAGKKKMVEVVKKLNLTLPLLDAPPALIEEWLGTKKNIPRFYLLDYTGTVMVKDTGYGKKMARILPRHVELLMTLRERRAARADKSAKG